MEETKPMNKFEPTVVGFCCNWCSYAAADLAGISRMHYPSNLRIIRLPCTGKVDVLYILRAFEKGADGVFIAGCLEGDCHYLTGNIRAKSRIQYAKRLLKELSLEPERLEFYNLSASMGNKFVESAKEFIAKIKALGPSPIKGVGERR